MLTLTKSLFALMLGFIVATLFGLVAIPFLKKLKAGQRINIYVEAHRSKAGTPTMGGLIFIIPTFCITLFLLLTGKIEYSVNLVIVLFVFFLLPKTTDKKMKVSLSLPVLCAFTSMWLWRMKTSHIAVAPNRVSLQETHDFEMQLMLSPWKIFSLLGRVLFEPLDFDYEKVTGIQLFSKKALQEIISVPGATISGFLIS